MSMLNDAVMYGRFAMGLRKFLRVRITLEESRDIIRRNLQQRDDNFLKILKTGVYGYSNSPYLPLLNWAGCEYGDVEKLVRSDGVNGALRHLRKAGVYFSFDEFKGRESVVRGSHTFPIDPKDFDNPFLSAAYYSQTGGSTGAGTRVSHDLESMLARIPLTLVNQDIHGISHMPRAIWRSILPNAVGINGMLTAAVTGNMPRKWFAPLMNSERQTSVKFRIAHEYITRMCRIYGVRIPKPEPVPMDRADIIARWMVETLREGQGCHVSGGVSLSLRIAIAAREHDLDLTGAVLGGGGEPPTPAKVATMTSTGARYLPSYHFSEGGAVGLPCANPCDCNDHHLMLDRLAVFQYPRLVPGTDVTVEAFNLTTLLPTSPKLLLNVEIDDYGVIEERACGCPWEDLGLTTHVREIRSYRKLTGEGMTLIGSEMERILDEVLPAAFGGSAQDYQLWEEEDAQGMTIRSLVVSPRVQLDDESRVIETVLEALKGGKDGADAARAIWTQSKTLRVKRAEPIWTNRGKLMPLHLASRAKSPDAASGQAK
jgi:hypothetical protein